MDRRSRRQRPGTDTQSPARGNTGLTPLRSFFWGSRAPNVRLQPPGDPCGSAAVPVGVFFARCNQKITFFSLARCDLRRAMNREKLEKMAGAVRTGGKGSVRRCGNAEW